KRLCLNLAHAKTPSESSEGVATLTGRSVGVLGGRRADRGGRLVDGRGDRGAEVLHSEHDGQADDGQDQSILGRRGAGLVTHELNKLRHWIYPFSTPGPQRPHFSSLCPELTQETRTSTSRLHLRRQAAERRFPSSLGTRFAAIDPPERPVDAAPHPSEGV